MSVAPDILNAMREPVLRVDKSYTYVFVNKAYCDLLQKKEHELIDRKIGDIIGKESFQTKVKPYFDRCFKGESLEFEYVLTSEKEKSELHFLVSCNPLYNEAGEVYGVVSVMKDLHPK